MIDESVAQENTRVYGTVMGRAMTDEAFRSRLLADPKAVLQESGMVLPEGMEIRAVENTESVVHLPLPAKPSEELSDDALEQVSGGSTAGSASSLGTASSLTTTFGTIGSAGTAGTA
jgi:hypothetical protein